MSPAGPMADCTRRLSRRSAVPLLMSLMLPLSPLGAQDRGGFVVVLGNDTIAVERYSRTSRTFEGDLLQRAPKTRIVHYTAALAPDGSITGFQISTRPVLPADAPPTMTATIAFGSDTAAVDIRQADKTQQMKLPIGPGASPMLNGSFALYEQFTRMLRASGRETMPAQVVYLGAENAYPTTVAAEGRDSATVLYFGDPILFKIDKVGRVLGANGMLTTNKVIVTRADNINFDALAQDFAARDAAGHGLGLLSTRDTLRATVGSANLTIDYGRPSKRGRVIWGGIVPWGAVWRTGANAATQFTTSNDLIIGTAAVPAGSYTLWTVPSPSGDTLIINKQTGQWGTDYDSKQDLVRIPMSRRSTPSVVEQFTMAIVPDGNAGLLVMSWDTEELVVPVKAQ